MSRLPLSLPPNPDRMLLRKLHRFQPSSRRQPVQFGMNVLTRRLLVWKIRVLSRLLSLLLRRLPLAELRTSDRRRLYPALVRLHSDLILAHTILAPRTMGERVGRNQATEASVPLLSAPSDTTEAASVLE
jgi:hypothetical protein